jgi:coenzyme F420-dependent oxidoreductase
MSRLALAIPRDEREHRRRMVEYAQLAEACGYEAVFVPEAWGRDAFTLLTVLAEHTRRIKLGTGIVSVFSRTPALLAQTVASLDELSGGRVILGLGTSGPAVVEHWHGMPFERPLRRTREYVEIIRLALRGERVNYQGEIFQLRGFRLPFTPVRAQVPIFIAALGPQNNRLTGRIADGWLPTRIPRPRFGQALAEVVAGAQAVGRALEQLEVAPQVMTCVTDDPAPVVAKMKAHLAYYVGGMGTFYQALVSRFGFAPEAAAIRDAWQRGERDRAAALVSDAMVRQLCAVGSREDCQRWVDELRRQGATMPVLTFPHGATPEEIRCTIEAMAPR